MSGLGHEAVAVVNLRSIVIETTTDAILAVEEHRRQRCDPQLADGAARIQRAMHLNLGGGAGTDLKLVRARHALAIEQCEQRQGAIVRPRSQQPEIRECWKLFAARQAGVYREASR